MDLKYLNDVLFLSSDAIYSDEKKCVCNDWQKVWLSVEPFRRTEARIALESLENKYTSNWIFTSAVSQIGWRGEGLRFSSVARATKRVLIFVSGPFVTQIWRWKSGWCSHIAQLTWRSLNFFTSSSFSGIFIQT
jgi:hypothetical protein